MKRSESNALFAAELLRSLGIQLKNAARDLRSIRARINRTNEAIRESQEAIARTDALIQTGGLSTTESHH